MANYTKEVGVCYLPLHKKYRTSVFLNLDKKYRSHFEIVALLLEAVKDNCATRFSIMKHAGINCAQLRKYLQSLTQIGFIDMQIRGNRVLYSTSVKGLDFLRQYHILLGMLLDAHTRNELATAIYTAENNVHARHSHSSPQIVTRLQHPP
jgi:predicted transcriptional regulator